VQGSNGQDQVLVLVLARFGGRQFTALNLLSARFFVEKAFFDWYHTLLSSAAISKTRI